MVRLPKVLLVLCIILLISSMAFADKELVFDEANLFTESEIENLHKEANSISDEYNMDIVIVTTDDAQGKSSRDFADDYFDYNGFGRGTDYDGILFLIDMDNREAYISTSGIGIRYLTDKRIESILDMIYDEGLVKGDFYTASTEFLRGTKIYLDAGIPEGQYNEPENIRKPNRITVLDIIISLIGGTAVGGIFYGNTRSRYKMPRRGNPYSYRTNSFVNLTTNSDRLINSFVTTRYIPKPPSNSGGSSSGRSTTHTSSSGRTHGGGGRKF